MIRNNLELLKDGSLDRLISIVETRGKVSMLKISTDLDIFILWNITYLDKWSIPNVHISAAIDNREFNLAEMIEELDRYKLYKNQIATLSTMIDRVIRLKNFDMVDRAVLKERDIKYIKIAEAIQDKLNELLVR
jgi:hypothetical protein